VAHYSADVEYDIEGFLWKNIDQASDLVTSAIQSSKSLGMLEQVESESNANILMSLMSASTIKLNSIFNKCNQ